MVDSIELKVRIAENELRREGQKAAQALRGSLGDIKFPVEIDTSKSNRQIQELSQQVLAAQAALATGAESQELQKQAALLQESLRYKKQLSEIKNAGFSPDDAFAARQLVEELNRVNTDRIEQEFAQMEAAARESTQGAKRALEDLEGQLLQAGAVSGGGDNTALQRQADLFQESLRYKRQLADIENAGFSPQDLARAKQMADELNKINVKRIEEGFDNARRSAGGLSTVLQGVGQGLGQGLFNLAQDALLGTIQAIAGAVQESVRSFAAYDLSLSVLAGRANVTRAELGALEATIQEVAATTTQSPEGVAELAVQLQALGTSVEDLPELVSTAARAADALGQDPVITGQVIKTATNIFGDFGLTAEQAADQIAFLQANSAALSSDQGIRELNQLFQDAGSAAVAVGVNMDELSGAFATLREAGFSANIAGTAIRTALLSLAAPDGPSQEAIAQLEQLGFRAFDAQGNFVGLEETIRTFGVATQNLSQEEQLNLATKIFGREGAPGVLALMNEVDDRFTEIVSGVANESDGAIQRAFEARAETLSFQGELLTGSLEALALQFGGSLAPAITAILQALNSVFENLVTGGVFDDIAESAEGFASALDGSPGTVDSLADGFQILFEQIADVTSETLDFLTNMIETGRAEDIIRLLGGAFELLGQLIVNVINGLEYVNTVTEPLQDVTGGFVNILVQGLAALSEALNSVLGVASDVIGRFSNIPGLEDIFGGVPQSIEATAAGLDDLAARAANVVPTNVSGSAVGQGIQNAIAPAVTEPLAAEPALSTEDIEAAAQAERDARIEGIRETNELAAAERERALTEETTAIRAQVADRLITEEEAERQIAELRQRGLDEELVAVEDQIAQVSQLRADGTLTEEEAIAQISDLEQQAADLRAEQVEAEIEAQEQLRQAEIDRLNEVLETERSLAEERQFAIEQQGAALQQESDILSARAGLQEAQFDLANQRLQAEIDAAEAAGDSAEAEALRGDLLEQQSEQLADQQRIEREQLRISQEQAALDLQRQAIQAEIATTEAEIALQQAQIEGASAAELSNLERMLGLRQQQEQFVSQSALQQQELNSLANQELATRQQIAQEALSTERALQAAGAGGGGSNFRRITETRIGGGGGDRSQPEYRSMGTTADLSSLLSVVAQGNEQNRALLETVGTTPRETQVPGLDANLGRVEGLLSEISGHLTRGVNRTVQVEVNGNQPTDPAEYAKMMRALE